MEFIVKFRLNDKIFFGFGENGFNVYDEQEDEPELIAGEIMTDEGEEIGSLRGYKLYNDEDFFYKCDNVSGDCQELAENICAPDGTVSDKYISAKNDFEEIFILDSIKIKEEYRNKGVASAVIKKLPKMLRYQFDCGSVIFLYASDYEAKNKFGIDSEQYKNGTERLIKFYESLGYKRIKDNVMLHKE